MLSCQSKSDSKRAEVIRRSRESSREMPMERVFSTSSSAGKWVFKASTGALYITVSKYRPSRHLFEIFSIYANIWGDLLRSVPHIKTDVKIN